MPFGRSGQRDDRRRRVFCDAHWGAEAPRRRSARRFDWEPPVRKSENYGDAEFLDELPRLIDLVPVRLPVILVLFVLGLGIIAGLEALYLWMPKSVMAVDGRVAAFDLRGSANLAVWFSAMTLALAGAMAIVVYSVRRYRTDDYHGRYRVWLWAALCCFVISLDQTAHLREGFKQMAARLTGTPLYGDGSVWWIIAYVFLLGAIGTRLWVDMFSSVLSSGALLAGTLCYGVIAAARFGLIQVPAGAQPGQPVEPVMIEVGAQLLGNLWVLLAMGLHARHVILDAEGLLPQKTRKLAGKSAEEVEEGSATPAGVTQAPVQPAAQTAGQPLVIRPPYGVTRSATTPVTSSPPGQQSPPLSIAEAEAQANRRLTKGERKALRQRLEKMRLERERRAG